MARPSPQTDRVVALVELLSSHPSETFTLADVTRRLGVNKSTCHSMLTALTGAGWLLRDPFRKAYRLGPALVPVGRAAASSLPALDIAHAAMVDVSVAARAHCAALAVAGETVTVVDSVRDMRASGGALRVGAQLPLRPPFGTAVVAWSGAGIVDAWLAQVPDDRRASARAALDATRARGYAIELSAVPEARLRAMVEHVALADLLDVLSRELAARDDVLPVDVDPSRSYAVSAVNAPVFDRDGAVTLVLSLTGFANDLDGDELLRTGRTLKAATEALTDAIKGRRSAIAGRGPTLGPC
ncbi:MAG TPA: helix-turn-helix domain-containing protein [Acidimicrobiia bacterium]|nr:helix-turn-helix domain-containing protein [Acidimicrobiia bacterium]